MKELSVQERNEVLTFESAEDIARALAEWSMKYPRDRVYAMHRKSIMDGDLIKIEEAAKSWFNKTNKEEKK